MTSPVAELQRFVRAALVDPVTGPRSQDRPEAGSEHGAALRRRRIVTGLTLALGALTLGLSLRIPAGDPAFYWATLALAAIWIVGALASGPIHLGRAHTRSGGVGSPVVQSLALAFCLVVLFIGGAVVVAQIPVLREPVDALLDHARVGNLAFVTFVTLINGVGEELYFRGALYPALPHRWAVIVSTLAYVAVTAASGIPLLVLAALLLGVVTGLQRRVTGGVLGPIIVHCTWSASMLYVLPPLLDLLR